METVKVSPKFQVVIPRQIRKSLGIKPGTKVYVLQYEDRIEYIPVKKAKQMRGFLKGIDTTVKREFSPLSGSFDGTRIGHKFRYTYCIKCCQTWPGI